MGSDQHLPIYNIKAVARLVGLLPVTIRAWERRYGLPRPNRGEQGYRLYSEYDVRTLRWLKDQTATGLSIGRAAEYLNGLRLNGFDPAVDTVISAQPARPANSPSLADLSNQLLAAFMALEEAAAHDIIRQAFTGYAQEEVFFQVMQPALVALGNAWQRGELPVAVEHQASQFCMQHLMKAMAATTAPTRPGTIVAACAPGENHQIGLLMLVVILRSRGWDVRYLGPDLPLFRLGEVLLPINPTIILFSANRAETARNLADLPGVLSRFSPQPLVVFGGQAFHEMRLPTDIQAVYLTQSPAAIVHWIEDAMSQIVRIMEKD